MSRARRSSPTPPPPVARQDLVVLAADKNAAESIKGLLGRPASLQIRAITAEIIVHPQHDPGCYGQSSGLLAVYRRTHKRALVLFDRDGCGHETTSRTDLEAHVEEQLRAAGWGASAGVVVIDPELDTWVWSTSPHVSTALGWRDQQKAIREWLIEKGYLATATQLKPDRPKEAMEAVLAKVKKPRSSSIYHEIAKAVSLVGCTDPAFLKFRQILKAWFPT